MIISHKHKFIFFKPRKVAGTSVMLSLAKHAGPKDVVTKLWNLHTGLDEEQYTHTEQNNSGFYEHSTPQQVRRSIPESIYNEYTKISIIRNPYDMVVSRWYHAKKRQSQPELFLERKKPVQQLWDQFREGEYSVDRLLTETKHGIEEILSRKTRNAYAKQDDFESFAKNFLGLWTNDTFYFTRDTTHDFTFLRFESLQEDYLTLCKTLEIPAEVLPRAKTKMRGDIHYSRLYTDNARSFVKKRFERQLTVFDYEFENKTRA